MSALLLLLVGLSPSYLVAMQSSTRRQFVPANEAAAQEMIAVPGIGKAKSHLAATATSRDSDQDGRGTVSVSLSAGSGAGTGERSTPSATTLTTEEDTPKEVGFMQSLEAALESGRDRIRDSGSLLSVAVGSLFKSGSGSQQQRRSETAQEVQTGEDETEADEEQTTSEGGESSHSQPWVEMMLARVVAPIRTGPMRLGVGPSLAAIMVVVVYALLVFAIGYGYVMAKVGATKGDFLVPLADKETLAPQEGFSDGLCDCGSSLPISLTACLIPCVRWSDTVSQAKLMSSGFYQALGIFTACLLVNTFFGGIGTFLIVILGTCYRIKIRQTYGVPTSAQTHAMDFLAWLCCTPCAIAQEARHVERAESLKS